MTQRFTITVPDDVADRLRRETNVSAYLTEAARAQVRAEQVAELLLRQGITVSPEGRALARARLDAATRQSTPEALADRRQHWQQQAAAISAVPTPDTPTAAEGSAA